MKSSDYLDAIRSRQNLPSDYAVAKALGVSTTRVSNWRTGRNDFDADVIPKVAKLLDLDPAEVLADIAAARAKTPFERDAFQRLAALARAAAIAATVTGVTVASHGYVKGNDDYTCRTLTNLLETLDNSSKKRRRRPQGAGNDGKTQTDHWPAIIDRARSFRRTAVRRNRYPDTSRPICAAADVIRTPCTRRWGVDDQRPTRCV